MCLHKFVKSATNSVPVGKLCIEQMFVLVRMQFHNHVDTQPVKRFERAMRCIYDIEFGTLQVHKNEISLCKCSGTFEQLRTLMGILVTRESTRYDKTIVNLNFKLGYLSSQKKIKSFQRHISSKTFFHFPNVRMRTNVFREEAIADHKVEDY